MLGKPARYKLGTGNKRPDADTPLSSLVTHGPGTCDCSGFVLWCLGQARRDPTFPYHNYWINTDSMLLDARGQQRIFQLVPWAELRPGDLLVYPGRFEPRGPHLQRVAVGHTGIVVDVELPELLPADESARRQAALERVTVIDCAAAKARKATGRAIDKRPGLLWDRDSARAVRYRRFVAA